VLFLVHCEHFIIIIDLLVIFSVGAGSSMLCFYILWIILQIPKISIALTTRFAGSFILQITTIKVLTNLIIIPFLALFPEISYKIIQTLFFKQNYQIIKAIKMQQENVNKF